ncbi:hypothetical protein VTI74DRAFT_9418 [Chaetomium olivicolor]
MKGRWTTHLAANHLQVFQRPPFAFQQSRPGPGPGEKGPIVAPWPYDIVARFLDPVFSTLSLAGAAGCTSFLPCIARASASSGALGWPPARVVVDLSTGIVNSSLPATPRPAGPLSSLVHASDPRCALLLLLQVPLKHHDPRLGASAAAACFSLAFVSLVSPAGITAPSDRDLAPIPAPAATRAAN